MIGFFGDVWDCVGVLFDVGVDVIVVDIVNGDLKGVFEIIVCFKVDLVFVFFDIIGGNVVMCSGV